ncbi:hypothetical protein TNCV_3261921 [Trichonephila clavipes]|nr:hypothetical protein TNCV_3261921 [Trichonephila clavipes]
MYGSRVTYGRSRLLVSVSDRGWLVTSSSSVPPKIHHIGERSTVYLSRAQTSFRGVVVRRGNASTGVVLVTWQGFKITRSVTKSPREAKQCDVNIHSLSRWFRMRKPKSFLRIANPTIR